MSRERHGSAKTILALSTLYIKRRECKQLYGADNGNKPE